MMARLRRGLWLGAMILAGLSPAAAAEDGRGVEYLYIEANEGGSSGGHIALRLGDEVFHFEHRSPGILVLGRDGFEHFRHRYGVVENRTIHASRIPVTEETYGLLVDRFRRRLFLQSRHLDIIQGLRDDRVTLEQMLSGSIAIEAAGLFFPDGDTAAAALGRDPDIADLRARVEAVYGVDFLDRRTEILRGKLAELDPGVTELPEPPTAADMPPAPTYGFPQRYRDLATGLAALETLRAARPLVAGAARSDGSNALAFTKADAEAARRLSDALASALVRLVASERPDGGAALLVGMARLVALQESRRSERWVVLDAFPAGADTRPRRRPSAHAELVAALLEDAGEELARSRERLVIRAGDGAFHEADFASFEAAVNRSWELRRALAEGRERRVLKGPLAPWRPALVSVEGLDRQSVRASLETVRAREDAYSAAFKRRWGYNLVTRNCVSEIFSEINGAFERGAEESMTRLGGRLEIDGTLNFIPAVSAAAVASAYPVTERLELPSYRRQRMERMYHQENPVTVFVRESNTLTSTIYRRNTDDSIFVFFTDDAVVARPLLGVVNLAVGVAASAVGLITLPVDGGATLWAGLKGALFSLPELFFQNIRKGSFEHIGRETRTEPVKLRLLAPGGG
jgi:hypothetical protein